MTGNLSFTFFMSQDPCLAPSAIRTPIHVSCPMATAEPTLRSLRSLPSYISNSRPGHFRHYAGDIEQTGYASGGRPRHKAVQRLLLRGQATNRRGRHSLIPFSVIARTIPFLCHAEAALAHTCTASVCARVGNGYTDGKAKHARTGEQIRGAEWM